MSKNIKEAAQIALFQGVDTLFGICEVPVKATADTVLVQVALATICGSDLHTVSGRRSAEVPCVLGHEVVGTVAASTRLRSAEGKLLRAGDRIIWSLTTSCSACHYCLNKNLPQKCETMFKYGHAQCADENTLSGGFASHIQLKAGTTIYHIPDAIKDEEAVPINCALATVINGLETIGTYPGETAIIHGAGMLGIYAVCFLQEQGYDIVAIVDKNANRLQIAEQFGATHTFNTSSTSAEDISEKLKELTRGRGVDLAVEVSGAPSALPDLIEWLGIGGRCLTLGYVYPLENIPFNVHQLVTKCINLRGIHNYHPSVLKSALSFIERSRKQYPFAGLIGEIYPLSDIDDAFAHAFRQDAIRIAVDPLKD
ncbi:zinc-binding dehydrogenase [Candidatus Poribacteria bacterium]|nr:zinc-binding dehydrogenase [Candidatus Poribacteria bacterium]